MIKAEGLLKNYPGFSLNCTIKVEPGMVTGLIGRNGSGKSTLFKTILGVTAPEGGKIELLGKSPEKLTTEERKQVAAAFSDSFFCSALTIAQVGKIVEKLYGKGAGEYVTMCRSQGLDPAKKVKDLSTGMGARLRVLTALFSQPKLLILDEPTVGLDAVARDEILTMLRSFMNGGDDRAILISSHISTDIESLCDDIYMISRGSIIFHEDTDELLGRYGIIKVTDEEYDTLDKSAIIKIRKESYGFSCLTDQRQFYIENYPWVTVEKGSIDSLILLLEGGNDV